MALLGKYVLIAEGARGSLAKELIRRFGLDEGREPRKIRHRAEGALGGRSGKAPAGAGAALVRLAARLLDRRRLVPLSLRREPRLGRLRRPPQLHEPLAVALRGIPALQDARGDPRHVRGRAAHCLRRARHHRRRLAERAEAGLSRRRADRLRGGLRQRAAHQGKPQRDAVRHARRRARRGGDRRRARARYAGELRGGVARLRRSDAT